MIVSFMLLVVTNLLIHDCSAEFDLKDYLQTAPQSELGIVNSNVNKLEEDEDNVTRNTNIDDSAAVAIGSGDYKHSTFEHNEVTKTSPSENVVPVRDVVKHLLSDKNSLLIFVW